MSRVAQLRSGRARSWPTRSSETILQRFPVAMAVAALLAACSSSQTQQQPQPRRSVAERTVDPRLGTSPSPRYFDDGQRIPRGGGTYKIGQPYRIAGRWYFPREEHGYDRVGVGSWYGDDFHGRKTANGEIYDMRALTAAHPTLPMPSYAWVTNLDNGRTILVRINDRGPYAHDRIIDLSRASAQALGYERKGLSQVRVRYAGPAPLDGDERREIAHLRQQPWYGQIAAETPRPRGQPDRSAAASSTGSWWRWW